MDVFTSIEAQLPELHRILTEIQEEHNLNLWDAAQHLVDLADEVRAMPI